jgi:hypothetical protein
VGINKIHRARVNFDDADGHGSPGPALPWILLTRRPPLT